MVRNSASKPSVGHWSVLSQHEEMENSGVVNSNCNYCIQGEGRGERRYIINVYLCIGKQAHS